MRNRTAASSRRRRIAALTLALCAAFPAAARPDYAEAIAADYQRSLGALWDHFHRNPELSFHETKTAARMAKELRGVPGMKVTEGVGGTGAEAMVTAVLELLAPS